MLDYIIKTEIGGTEIRLIESKHSIVVIYGMEKTEFYDMESALDNYFNCVNHAMECEGKIDLDEWE